MDSNLGTLVGQYGVRLSFILLTLTTPLLGSFIFAVMVIYPLLYPTAVDPRIFSAWWMYLVFGLAMLFSWIFFLKDALRHYLVYENGIVEKAWLGKSQTIYFSQLNGYMKNHVGGLFGLKLYYYFFFAPHPYNNGNVALLQISSRYKTDEKLDNLLASRLAETSSPFLSNRR